MQIGLVRRAFFVLGLAAELSLAASAQTVIVSPTSISFGNQAQGTSSSVHKVTLKNGQSSAITVSSIGTNLADYSQTNNCPMSPATLAAGATCTISITFTPSAQGARNATLTGTVSNAMGLDFGAMLKFVEQTFNLGNIPPGDYADYYANDNLGEFFQFNNPPLSFQSISAPFAKEVFLDPKRPRDPPDDD